MDEKVKEYIEKQKSPQKEICKKLYTIVMKTFPEILDGMKWGVPAFEDGVFYFVALKDHVNLGFSIKGLSEDEINLFDGGGKTMKVIEVKSLEDLNEKRIVALLKMVKN